MIWSFSENQIFRKCQRQWFYKSYASATSKDPLRREAYLLSKLQSISAWRGQIVDIIAEDVLVPALNKGQRPLLKEVLRQARNVFDLQLSFGRKHRLREDGLVVTNVGRQFAAFFAVEYGDGVSESDAEKAWADIESAFRTLYTMEDLKQVLRNGSFRIAQRTLMFDHSGAKVRAVPDLIVFFGNKPPTIVDWKVHAFGVRDYNDQLTTYALGLTRTSPHRDFPVDVRRWNAADVELFEVQLIRGLVRRHSIDDADVQAADDRIAEGITAIHLAHGRPNEDELRPQDFPTAYDPRICETCVYRKICWN